MGRSFSSAIHELSEIRGWWWEAEEDSGNYVSIDAFVEEKFKQVAIAFNLIYVTD